MFLIEVFEQLEDADSDSNFLDNGFLTRFFCLLKSLPNIKSISLKTKS